MDLTTQSSTIHNILHDTASDRLVIISAGGVDIYSKSSWRRVAWVGLANVTCGCLNNAGIYIGTSDRGVLRLPVDVQDCANGDLVPVFDGSDSVDLGTSIDAMYGAGNALSVIAAGTLFYLPNIATVYSYSAVTPLLCAINDSYIVWADATSVYLSAIPTGDWATSDATFSDVANRLQIESNTNNLQICHTAGLRILDCATPGTSTNFDTDLGAVAACHGSFRAGKMLAYAVADGNGGGRFGVLDITDPANPVSVITVNGDVSACWISDDLSTAAYDMTLDLYHLVENISPPAGGQSVRRDWTAYAEITDTIGGIQSGTITMTINGQPGSPTVTPITDGYAVSYVPGSKSGYAERVKIVLTATDTAGNTVSKSWWFVTEPVPAASVTDLTPPNRVCVRDVGMAAADADEFVNNIGVVWLDDIASPLIVTDVQARLVGKVAIDGTTFNEWRLSAIFLPIDGDGLTTRSLRQRETVCLTVPALGLLDQPCELLAKQRIFRLGLTRYRLMLAFYEDV